MQDTISSERLAYFIPANRGKFSTMQRVTESIKIPSNIKHVKKITSDIVNLLVERKVDKSHIFDIRLCVEEAVINAIEHGNKNNEKLNVSVSITINDSKIEVTIEDEGKGFGHHTLPDPTKNENVLRSHGRGVYLIHKLMDKVQYNDKGNRVKLIKYLR